MGDVTPLNDLLKQDIDIENISISKDFVLIEYSVDGSDDLSDDDSDVENNVIKTSYSFSENITTLDEVSLKSLIQKISFLNMSSLDRSDLLKYLLAIHNKRPNKNILSWAGETISWIKSIEKGTNLEKSLQKLQKADFQALLDLGLNPINDRFLPALVVLASKGLPYSEFLKITLEHFLDKTKPDNDNILAYIDIRNPAVQEVLSSAPDLKIKLYKNIEVAISKKIKVDEFGEVSTLAAAILTNKSNATITELQSLNAKFHPDDFNQLGIFYLKSDEDADKAPPPNCAQMLLKQTLIKPYLLDLVMTNILTKNPIPNLLLLLDPQEIHLTDPGLQLKFDQAIASNQKRWTSENDGMIDSVQLGRISSLGAAILNGKSDEYIKKYWGPNATITDESQLRKLLYFAIYNRDVTTLKRLLDLPGARTLLKVPEITPDRPTVGITTNTKWSHSHECAFLMRGFNVIHFKPDTPPNKFLDSIDCLVITGSPSMVPRELITPGNKPYLTDDPDNKQIVLHNRNGNQPYKYTSPEKDPKSSFDNNGSNPALEMYMAQQAIKKSLPFCMTCYGHQILAASQGANILENISNNYTIGPDVPIEVLEEHIPNVPAGEHTEAFLRHKQGVDPDNLGDNLKLTSQVVTSDGETVVQGLRLADPYHPPHFSVQHHPERKAGDKKSDAHFASVCGAAEVYHEQKKTRDHTIEQTTFLKRLGEFRAPKSSTSTSNSSEANYIYNMSNADPEKHGDHKTTVEKAENAQFIKEERQRFKTADAKDAVHEKLLTKPPTLQPHKKY